MLTKWEKQYIGEHIDQIDELIADADPLFLDGVISEGYGKERYDEWKNHERKEIREALAKYGYYPEHFINDKEPYIQETVVEKYPEYCGQLLTRNKKQHWKFVCDRIDETTKLDYIKTFLDAPVAEEIDNIIYSYEHIGEEYQQEPDCVKLIFDIHKQLMHGYAVHIVEIVRKRLDERN